ncbi:MAG: A/G-specific adenine glycosylase [Herminiimonas sp.]|nr:A/G-specific adenine glycosylase [Herminiimonas sp.]
MKRVVLRDAEEGLSAARDAFADPSFSAQVIDWQRTHGRHTLPWQNTDDAYRIWLSEIMLQQTQVAAVIPYYEKFLRRFPTIELLAAAPGEDVMAHWSGLGYYTRARNLHRCAQQVVELHQGVFPADPALLAELPGIGRSTAAAITAFAYGTRAAIMDGNVKRVFARVFGVSTYPGEKKTEAQLWERAVALLPASGEQSSTQSRMQSYTQGLMDLGATLCIRSHPACPRCPLASRCVALATDRVAELPLRKPKKAVPEKHAVMVVVTDRQQVLLTQRPDHGIWGGLLSLPELGGFTATAPDALDTAAAQRAFQEQVSALVAPFGTVQSCARLQPFSHGFTHFKLHVTPYQVILDQRIASVGQSQQSWWDARRLADAPLPAPVKKLLLALFSRDDLFAA